jgi:FkbM family methyltransferase
VDVGANIGSTVMIRARFIHRMGRRNKCVAFEPGVAGSLLSYSVELNGLSDIVTVDRRAADAKTGTTIFHSMLGYSASNSALDIHSSFDIPLARSTVVRTVRVDEVVSGPVIAKIDTEGNDFRVVRGMEQIIADHDACLQLELNPSYVTRIADPLEELRRLNSVFQLYIVDPDKPWNAVEKTEASPACIDRIKSSPRGWADLFAIKREMKSFEQFPREFESQFVSGS